MRVLTLTPETFVSHCKMLESKSQSFAPDLIVTIARGGNYVGANMFEGVKHVSVSLQRPTTKSKERIPLIRRVLIHTPLWLRNMLRVVESTLLNVRRREFDNVALSPQAVAAIGCATCILVVDDAVDSGCTLAAIVNAINNNGKDKKVASAVITVTKRKPVIKPDFTLYNNSTLVRFPWSIDAKCYD